MGHRVGLLLSASASPAYRDETLVPGPWMGHTQAFGLESSSKSEQVGWGGETGLQECMCTFGPAATVVEVVCGAGKTAGQQQA